METTTIIYSQALMLLAGAVIAAPLFKRLGVGTILGYLAAGTLIVPVAQQITEGEDDSACLGTRRRLPAVHHRSS